MHTILGPTCKLALLAGHHEVQGRNQSIVLVDRLAGGHVFERTGRIVGDERGSQLIAAVGLASPCLTHNDAIATKLIHNGQVWPMETVNRLNNGDCIRIALAARQPSQLSASASTLPS